MHEERVDQEIAKEEMEREIAREEAEAAKAAEGSGDEEKEGEGEEAPKDEEERVRPEFDPTEFNTDFEANNPVIEIPAEVVDDIDNDYDLAYTVPTFQAE